MMRVLALLAFASVAAAQDSATTVREGSSPQIAVDAGGTVRMVFGRKDTIFVVKSTDDGRTFGAATVVGVVPAMHLGNTRGPTIASSRTRTVVLSANNKGTLATFELDHRKDRWVRHARPLNDAEGSAPEGLATIAADNDDNFYAVWLDLRQGRQNNIYFTKVPLVADNPTANRQIYASPNGHVCECCRPSIAVSGRRIAIMFRNWVGGARDLYLTRSSDGGKTFSPATKLGSGTWKLDACPMDGGALALAANGDVQTVWRRELTIFTATATGGETEVASGKAPMLDARNGLAYLVWQDGANIKLRMPGKADQVVGQGRLPQVKALRTGAVLVAWERAGSVYYRRF
jgi:hypothetical protein